MKVLDLETLKTQTVTVLNLNEHFVLNSWLSDESGIYATKRKVKTEPESDCSFTTSNEAQELYLVDVKKF